MLDTRQLIDFLTATSHDVENWYRLIPYGANNDIGDEIKPFGLYDKAWEILPAGRIDVSNDKTQGCMLTLTGGDLMKWRQAGYGSQRIVTHAVSVAKVTRLDYAIDMISDITTGHRMKRNLIGMINRGDFEGLKADTDIHSKNEGYTQYFGSKSSDNRIRIYDKAAQQKILHQAWLRVELQSRGRQASNLAGDMASQNFADVGKAKINKLLRFPKLAWWRKMMIADNVELTGVERQPSKFWEWLENQVKPAMEKRMIDYDDNMRLIEWLSERLTDAHKSQYIGKPKKR